MACILTFHPLSISSSWSGGRIRHGPLFLTLVETDESMKRELRVVPDVDLRKTVFYKMTR